MTATIPAGTWVEVERVLLTPEQRAANLPAETREKPYVLRINGFLTADAAEGDEVTVTSLIGHEHTGRLVRTDPSYDHSFGTTVPELLRIGLPGTSFTQAASSSAAPDPDGGPVADRADVQGGAR